MKAYVKEHHLTGPAWNPNGGRGLDTRPLLSFM
jgi:hypothetical protein